MINIVLLDLLQQDIEELKGFVAHDWNNLSDELLKNQIRALILNLQGHLEELLENLNLNSEQV